MGPVFTKFVMSLASLYRSSILIPIYPNVLALVQQNFKARVGFSASKI